jgi:hypothetical protein
MQAWISRYEVQNNEDMQVHCTVVYIEQLVKEQKVHPDDYDKIDKIQCIKCKIPLGYHVHDLSKRNINIYIFHCLRYDTRFLVHV